MKGHVEKVRGRREREWDGRKKKEKEKRKKKVGAVRMLRMMFPFYEIFTSTTTTLI